MLNSVLHGDCLELMKDIPDASVDMILCDLPYGTTRNKWDSTIPFDELWTQYKRIIKDVGAIVLTAQTPFDKVLGASNLSMLRYEWIWIKNKATGHMNIKASPLKEHENILVFCKSRASYNQFKNAPIIKYNPQGLKKVSKPIKRKYKRSVSHIRPTEEIYQKNGRGFDAIGEAKFTNYPKSTLKFNCETGLHPTQKPVPLFEYLIKTYTNEGDVVMDNCAGSGTTAIACINTNRNYILMEKEEEYVDIINDRIKERAALIKLGV